MAKYICPSCTLESNQEICSDCGEKNEVVQIPDGTVKEEKYSSDEIRQSENIENGDEESEPIK